MTPSKTGFANSPQLGVMRNEQVVADTIVTIPSPLRDRMEIIELSGYTMEEKKEWIAKNTKVALGSDAFFPFGDNIERAHKSGVEFIAQAGGSVRDDHVIMTCDKYGITMAFTGVRLFHH